MPDKKDIKFCPECHITWLQQHPEFQKAALGYVKCTICGYTVNIGRKDGPKNIDVDKPDSE